MCRERNCKGKYAEWSELYDVTHQNEESIRDSVKELHNTRTALAFDLCESQANGNGDNN